MTISVRRAMLDDLDRLVPLFDGYRQFYDKPSDMVVAWQFLAQRMSRGESVVLIAEDSAGDAKGFAQMFPSFSSVHVAPIFLLNDLFVSPAARHRGIGTLLLKTAAEAGRAAGAVRLELSTAITNVSAQKLYQKLGWKRDEEFYVYSLALDG